MHSDTIISPDQKLKTGEGEKGKTMLLSEAFEVYRTDFIVFKNQSKRTEEAHQLTKKLLINFLGDMPLSALTFAQVRDWKIDLEKTRTPETVRMYVIRLRVVLYFLHQRGEDCLDGSTIPVPQRTDKVPNFISKEEVIQLIKACNTSRGSRINKLRNQAIISLLYASGIRVSELCALNRDDLHDRSFTVVGKGGKARLCFYDGRTDRLINTYLNARRDAQAALFVSDTTKQRITKGNIQFIFRNCCKRTGINCHPHTLRHSFATNLLQNNCNMRYVQELLGHASLQTTQMYTHVVNRDLQAVYAQFHDS